MKTVEIEEQKEKREATPEGEERSESKTRLLRAAMHVIRSKGYSATRVEDICAEAGLTKGGFFHHFKSKEELALAAADYWTEITEQFFWAAAYQKEPDALGRLMGYVRFRKAILLGDVPEFTCLVGTMVQETYATHPAIREACERSIFGHAATLEPDIAEAMREHGVTDKGSPLSLALYTQATLQGAFVLAKAGGGAQVAVECVDHLLRYLDLLFQEKTDERKGDQR